MKQFKFAAAFVFAVGGVVPLFATDYVWRGADRESFLGSFWSPVEGGDMTAPAAGHDYWQIDSLKRARAYAANADIMFPAGATLHIGSDADSPVEGAAVGSLELSGKANATRTITIGNLVWHDGSVWGNTGNGCFMLDGGIRLVQKSAAASHLLKVSTTTQRMVVTAPIVSDTDAVLTVGAAHKDANETVMAEQVVRGGVAYSITLAGDLSQFKGTFDTAAFAAAVFDTNNPLGDPNTPNLSALRLQTDAGIAFTGEFEQSTTRGIDVVGTQAYLMTWAEIASSYTVKYPISGTGKVIKHGPGTVTLAGAYSAGDLEVKAGCLVLDAAASFPTGQKVVVKSGARLLSRIPLAVFDLAVEEGGEASYEPPAFVVAYDAERRTVTEPIALGSGYSTGGLLQPVSLSAAVLPFDASQTAATLRLDVLRIAAGAATVLASEFRDDTPKTHGLPMTHFEVTSDASGAQTVTLVVRPYARSTADITSADPIETTTNWTDGRPAHEGWDYLLVHPAAHQNGTFFGDSLTVSETSLMEYADNRIGLTANLRLAEGAYLRRNGNRSALYAGNWNIVDAAREKAPTLRAFNGSRLFSIDLKAVLSGSGPLMLTSYEPDDSGADITLAADNSAFTGTIDLSCEERGGAKKTSADWAKRGIVVNFSTANNLGGALEEFDAGAMVIDRYSYLRPTASVTLGTENRGITVRSGGFAIPAGVELTMAEPLTVEGEFIKEGEGDLVLDCQTTAATTQNFLVRGGTLKPLTDDCCANLDVVFTNAYESAAATLVIDGACAAIARDGLVAKSLSVAEVGQKIPVRIVNPWPNGRRESCTLPICTLTTDTIGSASNLQVEPIKGARVSVSRLALENGVRYDARVSALGLVIVFR